MKKILFVVNTLGRAGAELSLLNLLRKFEGSGYEISLYVLMEQGEIVKEVPSYVRILNPIFSEESVLSKEGRRIMTRTVIKSFFRNGNYAWKFRYIVKNLLYMIKRKKIQMDKLLWRIISDGVGGIKESFDLAVAWLEGGSAYFVAERVNSTKKVAFIHIDYEKAGYTREMDQDCWKCFNRIFVVSKEAEEKFWTVYPEYRKLTSVFPNIINQEYIRRRSKEPGGFLDDYDGVRILTVGRLEHQKGYDIAVEAMKLLKDSGYSVKWYVLGEGSQREILERKIAALGLEDDFILLGAVENPYPYYVQSDLYVHAVRYEGQGIAVLEAQILGCAVVVSEYCGSQGQIENGKYGVLCKLTPIGIANSVKVLLDDEERRRELGNAAATKKIPVGQEKMLFELLK